MESDGEGQTRDQRNARRRERELANIKRMTQRNENPGLCQGQMNFLAQQRAAKLHAEGVRYGFNGSDEFEDNDNNGLGVVSHVGSYFLDEAQEGDSPKCISLFLLLCNALSFSRTLLFFFSQATMTTTIIATITTTKKTMTKMITIQVIL